MHQEEAIFSNQLYSEEQLEKLFAQMKAELFAFDPFVLALEAPMGAGKTTWVREFLRYCGLSAQTPVSSPTYTIYNEYSIEGDWFAHVDLYRAEVNFSFEELGLTDMRTHRGLFIEWPSQAEINLDYTHRLNIEPFDDQRAYSLYRLVESKI